MHEEREKKEGLIDTVTKSGDPAASYRDLSS
jgi:hypothetical protein